MNRALSKNAIFVSCECSEIDIIFCGGKFFDKRWTVHDPITPCLHRLHCYSTSTYCFIEAKTQVEKHYSLNSWINRGGEIILHDIVHKLSFYGIDSSNLPAALYPLVAWNNLKASLIEICRSRNIRRRKYMGRGRNIASLASAYLKRFIASPP
jgi:hypothetical protein